MEEKEIWKAIIVVDGDGEVFDYTGKYEVSNMGRVRSLNYRGHGKVQVLSLSVDRDGYLIVGLWKDGKQKACKVHRLVAYAFIPNDNSTEKTDVNHINEIKDDNRADNLEWCTKKYNNNHGTHNERMAKAKKGKLINEKNPNAKKVMCVETGQVFECIKKAQEWLGVSGGIYSCLGGKSKTCGGYHWKYVD